MDLVIAADVFTFVEALELLRSGDAESAISLLEREGLRPRLAELGREDVSEAELQFSTIHFALARAKHYSNQHPQLSSDPDRQRKIERALSHADQRGGGPR